MCWIRVEGYCRQVEGSTSRDSLSGRVTSIVNQLLSFPQEQNKREGPLSQEGPCVLGVGSSSSWVPELVPGKQDAVSFFQSQKGDRMKTKETL